MPAGDSCFISEALLTALLLRRARQRERQTDKPLMLTGKRVFKDSNLTEDSIVGSVAHQAFEVMPAGLCTHRRAGATPVLAS